MRIGDLEISVFNDSETCWITKHYNRDFSKSIELNKEDIYSLEFAVETIKRRLDLK